MEINSPRYEISRDEDHNYTVSFGGKTIIVPGVTSILDTVGSKDKTNRLMGWAKKMALEKVQEHLKALRGSPVTITDEFIEAVRKSAWKRDKQKLQEAGDIGTRIHAAIDAFIEGKTPILEADTEPGYNNFLEWLKSSGITLIKGDTYVANLDVGYGGAFDALGEHGGRLVLLDWKSSNYLKDENALQTAAYCYAFKETYGQEIDEAYVVRFGKETPGDIEEREVNIVASWKAFTLALSLKQAMQTKLWE
jgi:hypothetical protein